MRTVNTVTLLGNIARNPEMRVTVNGKEFATFVIATHRESLRDGEKVTIPEFHNLVAWGNLAQIAKNFCTKGRLVYIEGHLKTRSWDHESGVRVFRTEVITTNIIALSLQESEEYEKSQKKLSVPEKQEEKIETDSYSDDFFSATEDDFFSIDK